MTTRPELNVAVAGQKNKASDYNENFDLMMGYCEDVAENLTTETQNTLSVYQTVNALATSGTINLTDNSVNKITPTGNVTFSLPSITGSAAGKYHQILVQVNLTTTSYITADNTKLGTDYYFNGIKPRFTYTGYYDIIYSYDNIKSKWCVGAIYKGEV